MTKRVHAKRRTRRGQSLVELALVLPLLLLLLLGVVDFGLALGDWLRVNTAARDATRFAIDAGRADDISNLAVNNLSGLDTTQINVYIINGKTDSNGNIPTGSPYWVPDHHYGAGPGTPGVQRTTIQSELGGAASMPFVIVEVDFNYVPLFTTFFSNNFSIPMSSYALIQMPEQ